ncbi:hypothetical protein GW915_03565 [bacterium]|nr:hypothetical protein [bacterium]
MEDDFPEIEIYKAIDLRIGEIKNIRYLSPDKKAPLNKQSFVERGK